MYFLLDGGVLTCLLVLHWIVRSFFPGSYLEKREYVRKIISRYEQIEREFGLEDYFLCLSPMSQTNAGKRSSHTCENGDSTGLPLSPSWTAHSHHHSRNLPPEVIL